jgi:N-acetylglutamate synthase-like GNAT family acetyltransferase
MFAEFTPIPEGYSIRLAINADVAAIRAVLSTVRGECGVVDESGVSDDADLADLKRNYFDHGGTFEVIEDHRAKRIVGCAGLLPLNSSRAELCKMYLKKTARRNGLGKRLLEDLLMVARHNGFAEVWLETNSSLTEAISLYKKYGFQLLESDRLLPRCDVAYVLRFADGS